MGDRPYDCAIEILPDRAYPKGRLYSISKPERDAMERGEGTESHADTIIPDQCVIRTVLWRVEEEVKAALQQDPGPGTGPPGRFFVPEGLRASVLGWAHTSHFTCHPGVARTMVFLQRRFWWPAMGSDTRDYVAACPVCAQNKGSSQPSVGLLRPLPIPRRPWSHVGLDFVTGLPESEGNTVILTVVDRFSKLTHFVPLPKLPSARETADLLVREVFRFTDFPATWYRTEVLSSLLQSGRRSAPPLGPPSVCPLGFILKQMDRRRG
ncbi:hypothetical protein DPEC_G00021360 [Dallia pectoralis]|uniref:Uncharacterized protein n=1 Tax=Dallia pectoralis TaxID=75939 RepID=A0ACC2HGV2_DALPE|nr:hypothetical protein DPEC_G00021360 [Dallia pectoralis]